MKVLIWFLSALAYGLIQATLKACGISLGALPTVLIGGVCIYGAVHFCKRYDDQKRWEKEEREKLTSSYLSGFSSSEKDCVDNDNKIKSSSDE